jgi:eukaryotic-like serine/threonine-protein kinase
MTHLRELWEGVSLSGDYTLEQWLRGDDGAAFFRTSLDSDGRRAVVKLVPESADGGASQLDLWQRTRHLRHPNLVELLDCGRADLSGEIVLYAVFESPDDTLASALSQAPLTPLEAREVLDAVLDTLRYLHQQGLVAGALDPDHIVAVGDRIKISSDGLREADGPSACAEDVRALGELWRQALMPASPESAEIVAHAEDPNPLTRWNLAEIGAALSASPVAVPPIVTPPVPVPPVVAPAVVVPLAAVHEDPPVLPRPHPRTPEPAAPHGFPKWIFVGAAGVLLLILGLNLRRPAEVATRAADVSIPRETPVPVPVPAPAPPAKASVRTVPKPSPASGAMMWRVIAFTYRTRDAAAKKVQQLNQYHPGLHAAIFTPRDQRGYYLVALGGRMTHEDAVRLQRSARGKGLPRDLYVQNYLD